MQLQRTCSFFFFFNDTATTEIYTLSLHDALPILPVVIDPVAAMQPGAPEARTRKEGEVSEIAGGEAHAAVSKEEEEPDTERSEEHTSELQSQSNLVCRLLLEKNNSNDTPRPIGQY